MQSAHDNLAIDGGNPACNFEWPSWPVWDQTESDRLMQVLRSGEWWYGEHVRGFEAEFAQLHQASHCVSCTSGTTALEMGLRACGIGPGDEVIVPCYSFIATASAVVTVGAIPVFADINPTTLCIDVQDCERQVSARTRAIIPVHVSGRIADMQAINALASRHSLRVLEDAAHAWGSRWRGQAAGTLGDAGTFSFQVSKNLTSGEGGALVTNDAEIAELARSFSNCGRREGGAWYDHDYLGSNLRLTEFQAALLRSQLERLPEQMDTRQRNAQAIDTTVQSLENCISMDTTEDMERRSYHMFVFRLAGCDEAQQRDKAVAMLNAEGIPATAGWYQPLYRNGLFQDAHTGSYHGVRSPLAGTGADYRDTVCLNCEQVCKDAIWLPQHVLLGSVEQIDALCRGLQKVLSQDLSIFSK